METFLNLEWIVVYFVQQMHNCLLCITTIFQHLKLRAGWNHFFGWFQTLFGCFQPLLSFLSFFGWNEEKRSKKVSFIDTLKLVNTEKLVDSPSGTNNVWFLVLKVLIKE